jgi:hypothetical protein
VPLSPEQQAIIDKLQDGLDRPVAPGSFFGPVPLSINERKLVIETLRAYWLTPKEWKTYKRQRDLEMYEAAKKLARHGVPRGQRARWLQAHYGKSKAALMRFIFIRRHGR